MEVTVNSKKKSFQGAPTLSEMLALLNITSANGLAVAVNEEVISKSQWGLHQPRDGDEITIIRAVQGG